ncbi:MAG: hypothetical protein LBV12_06175 [Puniceicoccales bacterium]|jgi:hypothetical protein|nr:hypothetical protein [Puniceicoccales bacterium]
MKIVAVFAILALFLAALPSCTNSSIEISVENSQTSSPVSNFCIIREKPKRFYHWIVNPVGATYFPYESSKDVCYADSKGTVSFAESLRHTGWPIENPERFYIYTKENDIVIRMFGKTLIPNFSQIDKEVAAYCIMITVYSPDKLSLAGIYPRTKEDLEKIDLGLDRN